MIHSGQVRWSSYQVGHPGAWDSDFTQFSPPIFWDGSFYEWSPWGQQILGHSFSII
jgi:hypothetical protein